jgi:hypothetical protein
LTLTLIDTVSVTIIGLTLNSPVAYLPYVLPFAIKLPITALAVHLTFTDPHPTFPNTDHRFAASHSLLPFTARCLSLLTHQSLLTAHPHPSPLPIHHSPLPTPTHYSLPSLTTHHPTTHSSSLGRTSHHSASPSRHSTPTIRGSLLTSHHRSWTRPIEGALHVHVPPLSHACRVTRL